MSGTIGPKVGGSYEQMRQGILDDSGKDDSKIVRGSGDGQIYLHHGSHNIFGGARRTQERSQGSENLFNSISERLGGGPKGREWAQQIFNDVGLQRGGEFRVRDFKDVDGRLNQMLQNNDEVQVNIERGRVESERARLEGYGDDWQEHVTSIPDKLMGTVTWTEKEQVEVFRDVISTYDQPQYEEQDVQKSARRVYHNVDEDMKAQVKDRLNRESNNGEVRLSRERIETLIEEELKAFAKKY